MNANQTKQDLLREVQELTVRLQEAEEVIQAIRKGEIDGLLVTTPEGERVFTLEGAELPYRIFVESMNEGAATITHDGAILYSNTAFAKMLRLPQEKVIHKFMHRFIHHDDRETFAAIFKKGTQGKSEGEVLLRNNTPVQISLQPLPLYGASPVICAVLTDLTRQKKLKATIDSLNRSRAIFNQAADAIIICDERGIITQVSRKTQRYGSTLLLGLYLNDALNITFPSGSPLQTQVFTVADVLKGRIFRKQEVMLSAGGKTFYFLLSARPLRGKEREILGCVMTLSDVTARKQAEEEIRKLNVDLQKRVAEQTDELRTIYEVVKAERQRLYNVLEMLPAYVILLTADHHITFANRFFRERFGDDRGQRCFEYLFNRTETCDICETYKVLETHAPHHWEWNGPDGRNYDIFDFPFTDADGSQLVMEMGIDITDRKQAEEALRQANETLERRVAERTAELEKARTEAENEESRLEAVMEALPVGMAITDARGGNIRSNSAFEQVWGGPRQEIQSVSDYANFKAWWTDTGKPVAPEEWASARAVQKGESVTGQLLEIERFDGSRAFVINSASPVLDSEEKIIGSAVAIQDITALKKIEQSLRESEERLRFALESSHIGAWDLDLINHTAVRSLEHDRIFGYGELLPQWTYEMFLEHVLPEDREAVDTKYRLAMETKSDWIFECRIRRTDGEVRWIWAAGRHPTDEAGIPLRRMTGIVQDITERKQNEEEQEQLLARLTKSNKELEQFAYVASHDLQEPLRMVASFTKLLEKRYADKLDKDAREFIHFAVDGSLRMQKLIDDLLTYSRVSTQDTPFQPIDCNHLLNQAIGNLRVAIEESQAVITSSDLPTVACNGSQIVQLFQNLIGNAIKFRSPETPRIHISAEHKEDEWLFLIQDNGIGIDPQYNDRIFKIFQRLHSRDEYPGTGIGLALCMKIVELHKGKIWLESELGKGATFYFTIPA